MHSSNVRLLVNQILDVLFQADTRRLDQQQKQVIAENRKLSGNRFDGFFYQGEFITDLDPSVRKMAIKASLLPSLVPTMDKIHAAKTDLRIDKTMVKQTLTLLLTPCLNMQDVRDTLPNSLIDMIEGCRGLSRLRPEGFTLADDPRKLRQFQALKEKIDFYSVTRLLY